jgi:hypothetical protein
MQTCNPIARIIYHCWTCGNEGQRSHNLYSKINIVIIAGADTRS